MIMVIGPNKRVEAQAKEAARLARDAERSRPAPMPPLSRNRTRNGPSEPVAEAPASNNEG